MLIEITAGVALGFTLYRILNFGLHSKTDDTDSPSERSGLIIMTDHGTGVQYVVNTLGGMTVRVDRSGLPMVRAVLLEEES